MKASNNKKLNFVKLIAISLVMFIGIGAPIASLSFTHHTTPEYFVIGK